jgi:hypothetical protein
VVETTADSAAARVNNTTADPNVTDLPIVHLQ